ncbi:hypothetical protein RIF29_38555 [Crotalaria pallida]|uniref:Uncharacterized protein n=1 Tax=Crotalaria pallida TaxID=3830 RepID=A0AAN9E001_CROPI
MDTSGDPSLSKFPSIVPSIDGPQWDTLKMLADEATKEYYQQQQIRRSSISNIPMTIKIHHASMKPTKNSAAEDNEALKSYDFDKAETSGTKKPIDLGSKESIDSMDSASEGSSSSSLDLLPMKRLKLNDNDEENVDVVIDQEWVPGESSKMKKKRMKSELTKEQLQLLDQAIREAPTVLPQEFINRINA